ncbi:MAG: DUF3533 domain-containing protein [Eggerthellaceae bacterium]|nr:DUF3533 domain-containing protein [Eggerthellaceae bacterium]
MIEKLGKRKYVLPLGIIIAVACVFSLVFYPMANMEMKNLPFAIVCLDEGVETSEGDVNLGDLVVNKITESTVEEGEESPIQWTRLSSQEELDQAMNNNEFYGAMVIPRDFSQRQYDALVETMQNQIDEMQENVTDGLPFGSGASGGLSLPSMSAGVGATAGGTPQLSAEAQKMIAAAQAAVAGATKNAQGAAANFQKDQPALVQAQKQLEAAKAQPEQLQANIQTSKDERAKLEAELEALKANPTPSDVEQARIDELTSQIAQLTTAIDDAQKQHDEAAAQITQLSQAVEKAQQNATASQQNLATAQNNAKTAAANAMGVQKTAVAGSALATQGKMLASAMGTIKEKLSSLGDIDLSEKFADMGETAAAKAFVNIADQLKESADSSEETSEEDAGAGILVFLDMAKSPLVASQMQSSLKTMFAETGMQADIVNIHDGTPEGTTIEAAKQALKDSSAEEDEAPANPMSIMMSQQLLLIPTVMLSLIVGLILTRVARLKEPETKKERVRQLAKQVVLALVFSFIIALTAYAMFALVAGGEADFWSLSLFVWIVSFALMLLVGGLANIAFGLGVLAVVCIVAFGMMMGVLPLQALPSFWQDWVYPWAPQHYVGDGLRSILYLGTGFWNEQSQAFVWVALAGIVLSLLALVLPSRKR